MIRAFLSLLALFAFPARAAALEDTEERRRAFIRAEMHD